ncbi:MAG: GTP cyclohydrolase I FolE [Bdellovibrionales bacterium]|nr:GTP cyclohydrolase I FolE [Bdellovibrionales bacterium]
MNAQYSQRLILKDSIPESLSRIPSPDRMAELAGSLILKSAGEDLDREGLARTPERFQKAMKALTIGYDQTPEQVIGEGIFEAEGQGLVSVRDVEFYSLCEHHLLPFWGKASVAYFPNEKILGLSKIPRVIDVFARRFQVQERLTRQVAESLSSALKPRAIVVRVQACHLCMMMRGVEKQSSDTVTEFSIGTDQLNPTELQRIWKAVEPA